MKLHEVKEKVLKEDWQKAEMALCEVLSLNASDKRIQKFYLPLFFWGMEEKRKKTQRPFFIGLNAPQGAGKTTLSQVFLKLFEAFGINGVVLSIDDFYLTRGEQEKLAADYSTNRFLQQRGYPGTHDVVLGTQILEQLATLGSEKLLVPRYNKSAFAGRGDRHKKSKWSCVEGAIDIVLLEGWMLGFPERADSDFVGLEKQSLQEVNRLLRSYHAWEEKLDAFIHLWTAKIENIIGWRMQAEANMKSQGQEGMSEEECRAYIEAFRPAYEYYVPSLKDKLKTYEKPCLSLEIGQMRQLIEN